MNCVCCRRIGHITKDCTDKRRWCVCCFQCGRIGHKASNCPGNEQRGQDVSTTLVLGQDVNKAQPIIRVHVDQTPCSALLDSSCSRTIVSARLCCTWSKRIVKITTINGETRACCEVRLVRIRTDSGESAKVNVLVTQKDILCFDLLLRYNAIKPLSGVLITRAGTVQFLEALACAALRVDRLDLKVEFYGRQRIWTVSWK